MTSTDLQQVKWVLPTLFVLCFLSVLYFLLLFSVDVVLIFEQYISLIILFISTLFCFSLSGLYLQIQQNKQARIKTKQALKQEKNIEYIIWRNRYALQSQKEQLMSVDNTTFNETWLQNKISFANQFIYPIIPAQKVSIDTVSELIEKSLRGAAIGGVRPPLYNVRNINQ